MLLVVATMVTSLPRMFSSLQSAQNLSLLFGQKGVGQQREKITAHCTFRGLRPRRRAAIGISSSRSVLCRMPTSSAPHCRLQGQRSSQKCPLENLVYYLGPSDRPVDMRRAFERLLFWKVFYDPDASWSEGLKTFIKMSSWRGLIKPRQFMPVYSLTTLYVLVPVAR